MFETALIVGALADCHVRAPAKERPSIIGAAPRGCEVEPAIALFRLALRKLLDEIAPNALRSKIPSAGARNRLEVSGQALFEPMMPLREVGQSEVDHLMNEDPIL